MMRGIPLPIPSFPGWGLAKRFVPALATLALLTACSGDDGGPPPTLQGVSVTPSTTTLSAFGATATLGAQATNSAGRTVSDATFTWSSSDPTVATVSGGTVTAVSNGTTTITVSASSDAGSATGTATVVVAQEAASISVTAPSDSVKAGDAITLSFAAQDGGGADVASERLTWTSSDNSVATVVDGVVTAVAPGQVTITVSGGSQSATVDLTVFLLPLAIGSDTTITGPVTVGDFTVAAGRTVTVQGMAQITAFGRVEMAGTLTGDCTPISIYGKGDTVLVTGTIRNVCDSPTSETNSPIEMYGDGALVLTGATINGHGDVALGVSLDEARAVADSIDAAKRTPISLSSSANLAAAYSESNRLRDRWSFPKTGALLEQVQGVNEEFRTCELVGTSIRTENGENGFEGKTGDPGGQAGHVMVTCYNNLTVNNVSIRTGDGGEGGQGVDTGPAASSRGGFGGRGGSVVFMTRGSGLTALEITLRGQIDISVGGGGAGGSAIATGRSADALGGTIGAEGLLTLVSKSRGEIHGQVDIELRRGGDGGDASATAFRGADATGDTAAETGGDARAQGGSDGFFHNDSNEGALEATGLSNLEGAETRVDWTLHQMGNGGDAKAEAGNGGDGSEAFPNGGAGGKPTAIGGESPRHHYRAGADLTPEPGAPGSATVLGANGGAGWNGCSVSPFKPGGEGGRGGEGYAEGGRGHNSADGNTYMQEFGNGGRGGAGNGPGAGGFPGTINQPTNDRVAESLKEPNLTVGVSGVQCASEISLPFGISIVVKSDPAGHEPFVAMTSVTGVTIVLDLLTGEMRVVGGNASSVSGPAGVAGDEKWIDVNGSLNSDDSFNLTGSGTAAGFPNTGVRLTGSVTRDGSGTITGFSAEYVVGTTGNLPTGQPVSYNTTAGN